MRNRGPANPCATAPLRAGGARIWPVLLGLVVCALVGSQTATTSLSSADPVSLVDPFIGTEGNGHTFPGADVPFGMVQFSPVSVGGGPGGYEFDDSRLSGFSLTRLSGAGCTNYGDVPLTPTAGPPRSSPARDPWAFTSGFSHTGEVAQPGYYQVGLSSGISVALTATTRTGLGVFTYPASVSNGTLLIDPSASANHESATIHVVGSTHVVGSATSDAFGGGCGHPPGRYTVYFALAFAQPFTHFGVWSGSGIAPGRRQQTGAHAGAYVSFDTQNARAVPVRVGISYVSVANALGNLAADHPSWSLDAVKERAQARWAELLGRIRVSGGSQAQEETFYTALYHALLFPNVFSDANGEYLGEDGHVHTAAGYTQYTNFSEWDIYRGEMQLLALLAPRQAGDIIRSLIADGRQMGQLPRWLVANTETGLMVGDPADAIIGDAFAFGARRFNATLALREMLAGAGIPSPRRTRTSATAARGDEERPALGSYLSRGYIPDAPSTTLEYSIADLPSRNSPAHSATSPSSSGCSAARATGGRPSTRGPASSSPASATVPSRAGSGRPRRSASSRGTAGSTRSWCPRTCAVSSARSALATPPGSGWTASSPASTPALRRRTLGSETNRASWLPTRTLARRPGPERRRRSPRADEPLQPAAGRPPWQRRPRLDLGLVCLERPRALPRDPGRAGARARQPALPPRRRSRSRTAPGCRSTPRERPPATSTSARST